jgi:regulatory protein
VARLEELRYVDDLAYAAAFAGTVARTKSWGPRRVRQELARRGVSAGTIEAGMAKAGEEGASPSGNIEAALAKLTRRGLPAERRGRDRIRAALARRGFESAEISRAIEALGAAGPDGEPGDDETGDDA